MIATEETNSKIKEIIEEKKTLLALCKIFI